MIDCSQKLWEKEGKKLTALTRVFALVRAIVLAVNPVTLTIIHRPKTDENEG